MIRAANVEDREDISRLLTQLGYPDTRLFMKENIERLLADPNEELMVYEAEGCVIACLSLHYIPQLGMRGDIASISYLVVDSSARSKGIDRNWWNPLQLLPAKKDVPVSRFIAMPEE